MSTFDERLSALLNDYVRPSRLEVLRAKRLVLESLADGKLHQVGRLLTLLRDADGIPAIEPRQQKFRFPDVNSVETVVTRDHDLVRLWRTEWAAYEAIAELTAAGLMFPIGGPYPDVLSSTTRADYALPGSGASVSYDKP